MDILARILPSLGERIGRYELVEELGRGAFGAVYRARQSGLDADVAVKVMIPQASSPGMQFQARFEREAHVLRKLEHPASLKVRDYGKTPEGLPYLVTEFVRGTTLKVAIDEGPMPVERVLHIGVQVCGALAEAHHHGVIHRDLKPDNIMIRHIVGSEDTVKVLDFGIAKVKGDKQVKTVTGTAFGTPWYMAPEQARGSKELDGRADLYALGLILAECLTSKRVVEAEDMMSAVIRHAGPEPLTFGWDVQASALWPAIQRSTYKDPARRFEDALAMRDALRDLQRTLWSTPSGGMPKQGPFPPATRKIPRPGAAPSPGSTPGQAVVQTAEHTSSEVDTLVGHRSDAVPSKDETQPAEAASAQRTNRLVPVVAIGCALILLAAVLILRPWRSADDATDEPSQTVAVAPPDDSSTVHCQGVEVALGAEARRAIPLSDAAMTRDVEGAVATVVAIVSLFDGESFRSLARLLAAIDSQEQRIGVQLRFTETPPDGLPVHRFLMAADAQGRAWRILDHLVGSRRFDRVGLDAAFRDAELDGDRFNADVASEAIDQQLAADATFTERFREHGPTVVFVNGRRLRDTTREGLLELVADEHDRLAPLVDAGISGPSLYDCVQTVARTN